MRTLVLEHMRDREWYEASAIVGNSAWPDIVAVEWELKLLRDQRAVQVDDMRRWRLSPDVDIAGQGSS
ncbi:MAG: hypothetical protein ABR591_13710 [Candidatus Velthaea sp.]